MGRPGGDPLHQHHRPLHAGRGGGAPGPAAGLPAGPAGTRRLRRPGGSGLPGLGRLPAGGCLRRDVRAVLPAAACLLGTGPGPCRRPGGAAASGKADAVSGAGGHGGGKHRQRPHPGAAGLRPHRGALRCLSPDDIRFNGQVFFSADHVKDLYKELPLTMAPADKLVQLKNKLIRELQRRVKDEAKKDWVAKELDSLDLQQLHNLCGKKSIDDFKDEDEQYVYLSRRLAKRRLRVIADAIYNNYFLDFYNQYNKFLHQVEVPKTISQREWATMILAFQDEIECHRLELMHAAPLMYLRDLISGTGQNRSFQYVFIDEMQDYSTAMLIYLKHAFPQAKFTVLGDSEQALFKPLQLPEELLNKLSGVLKAKRPNLIALRRSYRSTTEITNFAKALLPDGDKIISFTRHGKKPRLLVRYSDKESQQSLLDETLKLANKHETVAILTKNQEQAAVIYQLLRRQKVENIHLLDKDASELPKGILILPIYLAKGLEFDAVLAADVSAKNLANTDEVGMIYTMASRAMHELVLLSNGSVSDAINEKAGRLLTIEYQLPNKN